MHLILSIPVACESTEDTANNVSASQFGQQATPFPGNICFSLHDMEGRNFTSFLMIIIKKRESTYNLQCMKYLK